MCLRHLTLVAPEGVQRLMKFWSSQDFAFLVPQLIWRSGNVLGPE